MCVQCWIEDCGKMSDLCIYESYLAEVTPNNKNSIPELEDNVWDEFSESDDHMVPHPGDEHGVQFGVQGDSCKKPRHEVISVASNSDNAIKYSSQSKGETNLPTLNKKDTMLEKGSWSHTSDGVFPASCDSGSVKEVNCTTSEETRMPSHCLKTENIESVSSEFCADDPILGEKCASVDNNMYHYPLGHISQTDNDLSFFDDGCEDKESNDLLYYGWPDDIGNFEDVDRMFRSCDSTFGLENLSNEDDLCWLSSSHSTERSEDTLMLGPKFSFSEASALNSVSEHHDTSALKSPSVIDSNGKSPFLDEKISARTASAAEHYAFGHLPSPNRMETKSMNWHKKQARHQNQSAGKKKDQNLENVGSFHSNGNLKQFADAKQIFGDTSDQVFPPPGIQQHKQHMGSDSLNYMQAHLPYTHMDYSHSSDQMSVCPTQSGSKSENNGHPSPSTKESSYASNQVQSMEHFHGSTFKAPAITVSEKRGKLCRHQDLQPFAGNFKHANIASPAVVYDLVSVKNQACQSKYEIEGHSEIEGVSVEIPAELDSSNVQESSCMSSVLDEISLEATSFRQLQQVMEQVDIRTKLCIRDSLYRLARSAEQRHNCVTSNGGKREDRDTAGALMADESNKGAAFMDMETDTNPIDRSIAHLLFHRPLDQSVMPVNDALSLKSQAMIHGSITSPPVMAKEETCPEETASGADKSLLTSDNE